MQILLVDNAQSSLKELGKALAKESGVEVTTTTSYQDALESCKKQGLDIALFAENLEEKTGLDFIKEIVPINAFLNCALQSPLEGEEFHEVTEGLGILLQIPAINPETCATEIVAVVNKIASIK